MNTMVIRKWTVTGRGRKAVWGPGERRVSLGVSVRLSCYSYVFVCFEGFAMDFTQQTFFSLYYNLLLTCNIKKTYLHFFQGSALVRSLFKG